MKNKIIFYILLIFICLINKDISFANEFIFETKEINILEEGNIIDASEGVAKSIQDNIEIKAEKFKYNKTLSILNATDGVVELLEDDMQIKADKIEFNSKKSRIKATGDVYIKDFAKNINIKSQNVFYNLENKHFYKN